MACALLGRGVRMGLFGNGGLRRKVRALQHTPFFIYLEPTELRILARAFTRRAMKPGDVLPASPFYYLLSGSVDVRSKVDEGQTLTTRRAGAFFSARAGQIDAAAAAALTGKKKPPSELARKKTRGSVQPAERDCAAAQRIWVKDL